MNGPSTNYDAAMGQFELLLNNKYFLLTFIETLEGQRAFNLRDKYVPRIIIYVFPAYKPVTCSCLFESNFCPLE